jgi:hypothetical protein
LAIISLGLTGCLEDDATAIVRYQARADRFGVLTVYEHFRSGGPDAGKNLARETASLEELWRGRDRIVPIEPSIFGGPVYIELSADHKARANAADDPDAVKISWDQIKIVPGKMFRDANGALAYYHETWIPGAVVDQWIQLGELRMAKSAELADAVAAERKRRDAGGARGSWKTLGEKARAAQADWLAGLGGANTRVTNDPIIGVELIGSLDNESLAALEAVVEKGRFQITRSGQVVTLRLPLSASDAKAMEALLTEIKAAFMQFAAEMKAEDEPEVALRRRLTRAIAGSVDFKAGQGGLELSVAAVDALNAINAVMSEARKAAYQKDPAQVAAAKQMADLVGPKVTVSEGVMVEKVVTEFKRKTGE